MKTIYYPITMILYLGVMFGANGAASAVRVVSSNLSKRLLTTLPQKALMKTIYYPITKSILKFFGVSLTKNTFAKGISKVVPVVGGVVSGGITLASMLPMGKRLAKVLDQAHFAYDEADFQKDMDVIDVIYREVEQENTQAENKAAQTESVLEQIEKAKQMLDMGIITEEEFSSMKAKLIADL